MKILAKSLIKVFILVLILCSCKIYRNVENLQPVTPKDLRAGEIQSSQIEKLVEGDLLLISTIDGKKHYLKYQKFQADTLFGTKLKTKNESVVVDEKLNIALSAIEKINVKRASAAATIPVVIFGALALSILIYGITASSAGAWWQN